MVKRFGLIKVEDQKTNLVNVRNIPSTDSDSEIVGVVLEGTTVEIIGEESGFYKVSIVKNECVAVYSPSWASAILDENVIGYIMERFVETREEYEVDDNDECSEID